MFDLDFAQRVMSDIGRPVLATEEVPLSKAVGRVLAEPLRNTQPQAWQNPGQDQVLDAGIRLQSKHVPHLASLEQSIVRVFNKLKVGVLTLGDPKEPSDEPEAARVGPSIAGPMLASLLDGLGAVAIAAPRVVGDAKVVCSVLDMLLKECSVVLVAGCMTTARHRQLQRAFSERRASLNDWTLCHDLGAKLTVAHLDDRVVVCLPNGLSETFMAFVLLLTPLIRRLQGRIDLLPDSRVVRVRRPSAVKAPSCEFAWARELDGRSDLSIRAHSPASSIDAIAWSDGIARGLTVSTFGDMADARYYPFSAWLR